MRLIKNVGNIVGGVVLVTCISVGSCIGAKKVSIDLAELNAAEIIKKEIAQEQVTCQQIKAQIKGGVMSEVAVKKAQYISDKFKSVLKYSALGTIGGTFAGVGAKLAIQKAMIKQQAKRRNTNAFGFQQYIAR